TPLGGFAYAHFSACQLHPPMINSPRIKLPKADSACQDDMLRLAEVEDFRFPAGMEIESRGRQRQCVEQLLSAEASECVRSVDRGSLVGQSHAADGQPAFLNPLGVDDVPADVVHGYRIGG